MAKLVDAPDSGSGEATLAGSNPVIDTKFVLGTFFHKTGKGVWPCFFCKIDWLRFDFENSVKCFLKIKKSLQKM